MCPRQWWHKPFQCSLFVMNLFWPEYILTHAIDTRTRTRSPSAYSLHLRSTAVSSLQVHLLNWCMKQSVSPELLCLWTVDFHCALMCAFIDTLVICGQGENRLICTFIAVKFVRQRFNWIRIKLTNWTKRHQLAKKSIIFQLFKSYITKKYKISWVLSVILASFGTICWSKNSLKNWIY